MRVHFPPRYFGLVLALAIAASSLPIAVTGSPDVDPTKIPRNASDSTALDNLRAMLAEHEAVLAGLHTRYKDKHPLVLQVKAVIANLKQEIEDQSQEPAPSKPFAANEPQIERKATPAATAKEQEKVHQSREASVASPLLLKSGLTSIQSLLEASDLALAQTLADELANDFAATSRRIDNADFRIAATVINRKLAALVQAIGSQNVVSDKDGAIRAIKLRMSKALVEGLLKLVPDLQRFSDRSTAARE